MTAPFVVIRALGDEPVEPNLIHPRPVNPLLHLGRPLPIEGDRYGGRRALWLVVARDGTWLATGTVLVRNTVRKVETEQSIPFGAKPEIDMAISRALDEWEEILRGERRKRERIEQLSSLIVHRVGEVKKIEAEIARLRADREAIAAELPDPYERISSLSDVLEPFDKPAHAPGHE